MPPAVTLLLDGSALLLLLFGLTGTGRILVNLILSQKTEAPIPSISTGLGLFIFFLILFGLGVLGRLTSINVVLIGLFMILGSAAIWGRRFGSEPKPVRIS